MPFPSSLLFRRFLPTASALFLVTTALWIVRDKLVPTASPNLAVAAVQFPSPTVDIPPAQAKGTAIFAGGCFWGMEALFERVKGVKQVVSGYAGGLASTAQYETVSSGQTGHAEAVQISFDPSQVSYGQLLKIYFAVAHDPTQLNRQGPDTGTQYRSAIFFANPAQGQVARAYIDQLNQAQVFHQPIVTQVMPLNGFYAAESYHQDFIAHNPNYPYVIVNDWPKIRHLQEQFPQLYRESMS